MNTFSPLILPPINRLTSRLAARLRRARPGSVLIIVIVLLLLLAILGAAYISTTRSARVASAQNTLNSDVDTMVNGVSKIADGVILDDLNDTFGNLYGNTAYTSNTGATAVVNRNYYQGPDGNTNQKIWPNASNSSPTSYNPGDIINNTTSPFLFFSLPVGASANSSIAITSPPWNIQSAHLPITSVGTDPWLADRIPVVDPTGVTANPAWTAITQSFNSGAAPTPVSILGTQFVNPVTGAVITGPALLGSLGQTPLTPIFPSYVASNGINLPTLTISGTAYPAADADGDGVADSLFFPIPGAAYDGLTWYAAVRIIDNNSAINANTAYSRDSDFPFTGASPITNNWGLFPSSVGLQEIINASDSLNNLNTYRFHTATPTATPYDESGINGNTPPAATARTDYNFLTFGDALNQQLGRRLSNPGVSINGAPPSYFQPLPISDQAALAYHFCLVNPESTISQTAGSILETLLPNSLWKTGATTNPYFRSLPYGSATTDANLWFEDNFDYANPTSSTYKFQNLRPLLVTSNPVSNYIQQVYDNGSGTADTSEPILPNYMLPYGVDTVTGASNPTHYRGIYSATTTYNLNDVVLYPGPVLWPTGTPTGVYNGPSYTFVWVATNSAAGQVPANISANNVLQAPLNTAYWKLQPWSTNPVKANVNTATFPELFRAFWCVMAGNPSYATPFGTTGVDGYKIYDQAGPTPAAPTGGNLQAMFRSPLRDPLPAPNGAGTANVSLMDIPTTPTAGGTPLVTNTNTMLLRAALAAVNMLGLRDNSQNVISRTIDLTRNSQIDVAGGAPKTAPLELQVFSNAPNPVISEVYADTDASDPNNGSNPYVAVELYNPYGTPMVLVNWQLGLVNRSNTTGAGSPVIYPHLTFQTYPPLTAAPPTGLSTETSISVIGSQTTVAGTQTAGQMLALNAPYPPTTTPPPTLPPPGVVEIPPHGYALLENYNANAPGANTGDAKARPAALTITGSPTSIQSTGIWYGTGGSIAPNVCDVYVQNLQLVVKGAVGTNVATSTGGELVLLRPRQANGAYTSSTTDPQNYFDEGDVANNTTANRSNATYPTLYTTAANANLFDMVPVDSFDFTGLIVGGNYEWSYIRPKCYQAAGTPPIPSKSPSLWFKALFPGFYSVTAIANNPRQVNATATAQISGGVGNTWTAATGVTAFPQFGLDSTGSYTNNFPPIQVFNSYFGDTASANVMHFPNSVVSPQKPTGINAAPTPNLFPFGTFARNGDMLDIPFIGSYRIRVNDQANTSGLNQVYYGAAGTYTYSPYFLEMNPLPMDASFAAVETSVPEENAAENIGRFMPMSATNAYATAFQTLKFPDGTGAGLPLPDYYAWTRNLFNYLTVQSSTDTYTPNFDPNISSGNVAGTVFAYPPQNAAAALPPTPTHTADATATDQTKQDNVGVQGLININTASWKVLSTLPMITKNEDANWATDNVTLAKAIVAWREKNGPFMSIFDLNNVIDLNNATPGTNVNAGTPVGFQNAEGWLNPANGGAPAATTATAPQVAQAGYAVTTANGIMSPPDPAFPNITNPTGTPPGLAFGVPEDYQSDCAVLNRISNLITTRSDTFTVYVEVQGWQNAGLPTAQPVITRRYAYIVDRSAVNADPSTRYLKTVTVPND